MELVICYERGAFSQAGAPTKTTIDDEDNRSERPRAWVFRTHADFVGPVQQDEGGPLGRLTARVWLYTFYLTFKM